MRTEFMQLMRAGDNRTPEQQAKMEGLLTKMRESGGRGSSMFGDMARGGRGGRGGDRESGRGGRGTDRSRGSRGSDRGRRGRTSSFDFGRRGNNNLPGDTGDVKPRPEGKFDFGGLEEGVYVVDVGSPDHEKLRSPQIELREGYNPVPLDLVVKRGITISGIVQAKTAGKGTIQNAEVELRLLIETDTDNDRRDSTNSGRGGRGGFSMMRFESGPRTTRIMRVRSADDGSFEFLNAPPGRYLVRAEADNFAQASTEPFELNADRTGMKLTLGSLAVIEGRVSGIPVGKSEEVRVMAFSQPRTMKDSKVKEDGTYEITGLEPGEYTVRAFIGDSRRFIFREMFRGMSPTEGANSTAPQADVLVKEGGRHRFNVKLTETLSGSVVGMVMVNGKGAQGYRVSLRKVEQNTGQQTEGRGRGFGGMFGRGNSATVDQNGEFEIKGVEIGEYTASVSASSSRGRWSSSQAISRHRIYVSADQVTTVPMVTINYGSLVGTVTLPPEQDSATKTTAISVNEGRSSRRGGGRISLYKGVTEVPDPSTDSGAEVLRFSARLRDNKFEFAELPTGDYLLQVRLSGRESVTKTLYVAAGEKKEVEVLAGKKRDSSAGTQSGPAGAGAPGAGKGKGKGF